MTHQEFIEVSKLCKDFENELIKRVFDNSDLSVRKIKRFPYDFKKYLCYKLKKQNLPVRFSNNEVLIPSKETDSKEVPEIINFLKFAKREICFYLIQEEENEKKGYCREIQKLWSKAGNKYKNQVCFYEGQYICFERLKYKLKSTEKARTYLLPEPEQTRTCLYQDEKYQFWELCYKLKQEKIENPYETALNLIIK